jgi:ABC-type hemin transport system ATPase subunit
MSGKRSRLCETCTIPSRKTRWGGRLPTAWPSSSIRPASGARKPLDEPSGGLAPRFVEEIAAIIRRLKDAGTTMLMVEQNIRLAFRLADRFIVLRDGRIVEAGRVADLAGAHDDVVRRIYL